MRNLLRVPEVNVLEVANQAHLGLLKPLIVSGAKEGSWDGALAFPGPALDGLVTKIGYALEHGVLLQFDPRTRQRITTRIAGWVFRADPVASPIGFGLFKEFYGDTFELWLCAIESSRRGANLGRQMITELMSTSLGRRTLFARCALGTDGGRRCAHVLKSLGFESCKKTSRDDWLLHRRTPAALAERIAMTNVAPLELAVRQQTTTSMRRS